MAHIVLQDKYVSAPFIRSMLQQPDDSDNTTQEVMIIQNALVYIGFISCSIVKYTSETITALFQVYNSTFSGKLLA